MSPIRPCPNASLPTVRLYRFIGAVAASLLTLSGPAHAAVAGTPASGTAQLPPAAIASEEPALLQFMSGGHVLGFNDDGYFVSNGTYALRVRFEGAKATTPSSDGPAAEAADGAGGIAKKAAPLSRVSYSDVWPGIDVTYDAPRGGIARSTWTLMPGADPAAIRLRYNNPVEVTSSGELGLRFETGALTESHPVAWQDVDGHRQPVEVAFESLADDLMGFRVGHYRHDQPLIIDPTLTWNTFLGSGVWGGDDGGAIAVDGSGNVYVAGESRATWGSPVRAFSGGLDTFAAKLSPSGALIWNTFLGGTGSDFDRTFSGNVIAVDGSGNVYVAGPSNATWGSPVRAFSGRSDAFAAKLSPSGALIWNTFIGGPAANNNGYAIAIDGSGNVYVAGTSNATWGSPVRAFSAGTLAGVVAKLSPSGALIWNTFLGVGWYTWGQAIAVDVSGNVYVAGRSEAAWTGSDFFVARLSSAGALIWETHFGGREPSGQEAPGLAVDGSGNVYVGGTSYAPWGSPVKAFTSTPNAFGAKLSASGALIWNTFLPGYGRAMAVDGAGNAYLAGYFYGGGLGDEGFAAKLNSSGTLLWNTNVGAGGSNDKARAIAVDGSGNVYVAGYSERAWGSPVRAHSGGLADAFVAKLAPPMTCGNGVNEGSEQCDDGNAANGDCCSSSCQFESSTTVCRVATGACDLDENCTGASANCPADIKSTTECRSSAGDCDVAENCDGVRNNCPANGYRSASEICRASVGACDILENCTGSQPDCPADVLAPSTQECRPTAGPCDVAETCSGADSACPADSFAPSTTECREAAGICDAAESCTGSDSQCPADSFASASQECRPVAGPCDVSEVCTGSSADCPADFLAPSSQECRTPAGVCDVAENCYGNDTACPIDTFAAPSQECRAAAGICDLAENCTGSTATCPADAKSTAVCRAASGECDVVESCDGVGTDCPVDVYKPSGMECRPSVGVCNIAENCTGSSTDCPADSLASQGTPCRSTAGQCDEPEACTGAGADCPADAKTANTEVCRATTGTCDASEYCDGAGNTCPIDSGAPACGISDFCCPGTCGANEDPDCCNNSITFSNCLIKPTIAVGKPDRFRISCSVLDATASTNGLHLDTDPLWLVIRDATTTPAACLEELLSPGPCIGDICDTGTFELESCSEDRDCRPCRQTGNGFLCKGKARTPGISKVALKLLRDGSGRRYKLVMTGSTTDIQCSFASLPWSLGIVQGDDCGDVACTQLDGSRISCPGRP